MKTETQTYQRNEWRVERNIYRLKILHFCCTKECSKRKKKVREGTKTIIYDNLKNCTMIWISSRKNVYRSSPIVIVHLRHRDSYLVTVVQVKQSYRIPPEVEIFLALRKVHDDRRVVLDTKRTRRHRHRLEYSNEFYSSGVESETPKLFRGNVTGNFWSNILLIYELIIYIYM